MGVVRTFKLLLACLPSIIEIEKARVDRRRGGLIKWIMITRQVRMFERLAYLYPPLWAKRQAALEEVNGEWGSGGELRMREDGGERLLFAERKGTNVFARAGRSYGVEVINGGCAEDVEDYGELVVIWMWGQLCAWCK